MLFFSCRDDAAFIGFAKEPRLHTHYVDIPLNPSVLQFDGVLTRNTVSDPLTRILVGQYNDPQFGNMDVRAYVGIAPPLTIPTPSVTATFDSLVLQLRMDYYYYGSNDFSTQHIKVHEVLDTLKSTQGYYTSSEVAISAAPLGQTTFYVNPGEFDDAQLLNADADTSNNKILNIRIPIHGDLGANLLSDLANELDIISDVVKFMGKYKGLAMVMSEGDKILGINPQFHDTFVKATDPKLSLYYTDGGVQTRTDFLIYYANNITYGLTYPVVSFSTITTDRSTTALSGIQGFKNFTPSDNRLYIQSGTALITKFELANFYKYIDTLENIVFNSAELVVTNVGTQKAPFQVQLRMLDSVNHFRGLYIDSLVNSTEAAVVDPYLNKLQTAISPGATSSSSTVDIKADNGVTIGVINDPFEIDKIFITEFCQQIFRHKHDRRRVSSFGLMPAETEFQKSVNTLILDPYVSLRLYYSKPVINIR